MSASDFAVSILVNGVDSIRFPRDPWGYGWFEFSRREAPFPAAEAVFRRELTALEAPPTRPTRIRTYVCDVRDEVAALRVARDHAAETLALMRLEFDPGWSPVLTSTGCVLNLRTGRASGLPPPARTRPFGIMEVNDEVAFDPGATLTLLLSADPRHFGELGMALRRSAHWRNVATSSPDKVQYILMTWMACEVLCKTRQSENITSKVLAAVGFYSGPAARVLRREDRLALKLERGRIEYWRRELFRVVDSCRKLRNAIVHEGCRDIELAQFLSDADFITSKRFFSMAVPRLQGLAVGGIQIGMRRVAELWSGMERVLYAQKGRSVAEDLLGVVIYVLENPMPFDLDD